MENRYSANDNIALSSMTKEELEKLLKSALRDVDTHLDQIKSILCELRLRGNADDVSVKIEEAWMDFLQQNEVSLYDFTEEFSRTVS